LATAIYKANKVDAVALMVIDVFGKRLSFFFNAHNDFFEEIAKFRAARKMWAIIMKQMGAKDERAMMLRFHTQTGGSTLTAQQPHNNIARVTLQALAAVLGGTQSLHTNGFDEAISLPTEQAAGIALRTQQIIGYESGVTHTVDPMGGSYYVEYLTEEIEKIAWNYIEKIDAMGGSVMAIEQGYIQDEIARSSYEYQVAVEKGEQIIVGVNKFQNKEEIHPETFSVNDSIREKQILSIEKVKSERNNEKVVETLSELRISAKEGTNLMPRIIECVEHYCTLGEIADELRNVFGEYKG